MDRQPGSLSLLARFALGASMTTGLACTACAGSGPPIVEHPRPVAIVAVAPESDVLAGAVTFRTDPGAPPVARSIRPSSRPARALSFPAPFDRVGMRVAPRWSIRAGAWDLALGEDEARASGEPGVALSEALTLSAGPAPRLGELGSSVAIHSVSEEAVEEGAWEASRR